MWINEETLHYVARFLDHYDVANKLHKDSVKQLRDLSDQLLERLYKPANISVVRKPKQTDDK